MTQQWPLKRLGSLLEQVSRAEPVEALGEYNQLGIRLDGKGPFHRETRYGSEISATKLYRVKEGDFIYSRLYAWQGAFGIIGPQFDGFYVSNEFPAFRPKSDQLDTKFLLFWFRLPSVLAKVEADCTGSTPLTRNRYKENFFLDLEIPLPPLDEQRRIVARIEAVAARIEEARGLRQRAVEEAEALLSSTLTSIWSSQGGWKRKPISELASTVSGQVDPTIEPYASLPHINGEVIEARTCRLLPYRLAREDGVTSGKYHFPAGSILYSKIRPYLRKAVQVPVEGVCSADIYAFETISAELEPRFFMYSLIAPDFSDYADSISGRTRMPKLNQKQLFVFELAYPSKQEQQRIVEFLDGLQSRVDDLKRLQAATAAELDALLPSILDKAFKGEL